jgi:hypothetical protein
MGELLFSRSYRPKTITYSGFFSEVHIQALDELVLSEGFKHLGDLSAMELKERWTAVSFIAG